MDNVKSDGSVTVAIDRSNIQKSASFCEIYANDTLVQVTAWDCRLMLGVLTETGNDQTKVGVIRVADVRMSLQHAKRVAQILTEHIERYEARHGPLHIPGGPE